MGRGNAGVLEVHTVAQPSALTPADNPLYGDVHFYDYTDDCEDPDIYPLAGLVTEFGFQSYPSLQELKDSVGPGARFDRWPLPLLTFRQRHPDGDQQLMTQILRHMDAPSAVGGEPLVHQWIHLSQVQQARCMRAAVESWRSQRPQELGSEVQGPSGLVFWQLNDVWAGPSWSSVEASGRRKPLYFQMQQSLQPLGLQISLFQPRKTQGVLSQMLKRQAAGFLPYHVHEISTAPPPFLRICNLASWCINLMPATRSELELHLVNDLPWPAAVAVEKVQVVGAKGTTPLPGFVSPVLARTAAGTRRTIWRFAVGDESLGDWWAIRASATIGADCSGLQ